MRLRWTSTALDDLESIHAYLSAHRPTWTSYTIKALYETARSLRTMQERGRNGRIPGTKELVVDRLPYVIVYRVNGQVVELIHINHTSQDRPVH